MSSFYFFAMDFIFFQKKRLLFAPNFFFFKSTFWYNILTNFTAFYFYSFNPPVSIFLKIILYSLQL